MVQLENRKKNQLKHISKYYNSNHFPIIDYSMEVSTNGGTLKYLVYNGESIYKWMIWGYPFYQPRYFQLYSHYIYIYISPLDPLNNKQSLR